MKINYQIKIKFIHTLPRALVVVVEPLLPLPLPRPLFSWTISISSLSESEDITTAFEELGNEEVWEEEGVNKS